MAEVVHEVDHPGGRAIDADRVEAIAVPVSGDWDVARIAEGEVDVCDALCVGVPQVEPRLRRPVDADCVDPVAVPVSRDGQVSRDAVVDRDVRDALIIGVSKEQVAGALAIQAHRVDTAAVPVAGIWRVPGIAIVEGVDTAVGVTNVPDPRVRILKGDLVRS